MRSAELVGQQGSPEIAAVIVGLAVLAVVAACAIVAYVRLSVRYNELRDRERWLAGRVGAQNQQFEVIYWSQPQLRPIDAEEGNEWPANLD